MGAPGPIIMALHLLPKRSPNACDKICIAVGNAQVRVARVAQGCDDPRNCIQDGTVEIEKEMGWLLHW